MRSVCGRRFCVGSPDTPGETGRSHASFCRRSISLSQVCRISNPTQRELGFFALLRLLMFFTVAPLGTRGLLFSRTRKSKFRYSEKNQKPPDLPREVRDTARRSPRREAHFRDLWVAAPYVTCPTRPHLATPNPSPPHQTRPEQDSP